ncbi:hypothetical protein BGZ70_003078 [Mortierella alpina]|uniref:Uncharacterized protein n=1 Tax=Mortierella alpina TaxID=64518 RepID=A0A9P6JES2_MORAP|nr:hypothetical protein BGZ70_003078 [Mortierella alpina]
MRFHHLAILVLLALLHTSFADTVLGGIVDYLPTCYKFADEKLIFVEYNAGFGTTCNSNYGRPLINNDGRCAWMTRITQHSYDKSSDLTKYSEADNAHHIPDIPPRLKFVDYYGHYDPNNDNVPVVEGYPITDRKTRFVSVSLGRGVKMVRFPYLPVGQRAGWSQGVQLRFTADLVKRLNQRDFPGGRTSVQFDPKHGLYDPLVHLVIDTHCFYITALIPFERRMANQQFINCVRLNYHFGEGSTNVVNDPKVDSVAAIINCEQGTNLQNAPAPSSTSLASSLEAALKHIVVLGMSFVPIVGPILSIGLDLVIDIVANPENYRATFTAAGVASFDEVLAQLVELSRKGIKKV